MLLSSQLSQSHVPLQATGHVVSASLRSVLDKRHWRLAPSRHSPWFFGLWLIARRNHSSPCGRSPDNPASWKDFHPKHCGFPGYYPHSRSHFLKTGLLPGTHCPQRGIHFGYCCHFPGKSCCRSQICRLTFHRHHSHSCRQTCYRRQIHRSSQAEVTIRYSSYDSPFHIFTVSYAGKVPMVPV